MTERPVGRLTARLAMLVMLLGIVAHHGARAQTSGAGGVAPHSHADLKGRSHQEPIPEFSLADTVLSATVRRNTVVTNRTRSYDAFVTADTLLFVGDRKTGRAREVRGLPFAWRPFSGIAWSNARTLVFDRYSSPHDGMHYAVDVVSRKLVSALAFHDADSEQSADERVAIAVADSVLAALSSGDGQTLARLTLDSSVVGGAGLRNGVERVSLRRWMQFINRTGPSEFTERGFDATARVHDRVAQVWMPYDLYVGDKWSHCGVDAFTLMKSEERWRVAALIYTIEQPPACRKHPAGPPQGPQ